MACSSVNSGNNVKNVDNVNSNISEISDLQRLKTEIRCALLPEKHPISAQQLNEYYSEMFGRGKDIPFGEFGYKDLDAFLGFIKDTVERSIDECGLYVYKAKPHESTKHIEQLVARQKSPPPKNSNYQPQYFHQGGYRRQYSDQSDYSSHHTQGYYPCNMSSYHNKFQHMYDQDTSNYNGFRRPGWQSHDDYDNSAEAKPSKRQSVDSERRPRINMAKLQRQLGGLGKSSQPARRVVTCASSSIENESLPSSSPSGSTSPISAEFCTNEPLRVVIKQGDENRQVTNLAIVPESLSISSTAPSYLSVEPVSTDSPPSATNLTSSVTSLEAENASSPALDTAPITGLIIGLYEMVAASAEGAEIAEVARFLQLRCITNALHIAIRHYSPLFELKFNAGLIYLVAKPGALEQHSAINEPRKMEPEIAE